MAVDPKGTQTDQMPIALPLFSGANHRAMMSGAVTAMRLKPAPSTNRLNSKLPMPLLKAPLAAPIARIARAINPVRLYPNF